MRGCHAPRAALAERADLSIIVLLFLLDVVLVATFLGRRPSRPASSLSVACFDSFMVPPHFALTVAHAESLVVFAVMFVVTLAIGQLTRAYREAAREAQVRADESALLHRLADAMSGALTQEAAAERLDDVCRDGLGAQATVFLPRLSIRR